MINNSVLKKDEQVVFNLRSLYKKYGYLPYKMSKFEEYDLYADNKNFLVSNRIVTFTDEGGKLLALKPDVTLSILKNGGSQGEKKKVYYNETVYRTSGLSSSLKELMQTGIECIGDINLYDIFETVLLALKSLQVISNEYVLDISHLGFISTVLEGKNEGFKKAVIKIASEKNVDEVNQVCKTYGYETDAEILTALISLYGNANEVIAKLQKISVNYDFSKPITELNELFALLNKCNLLDKINLDFSLTGDINYYNGIVFKGYVNNISSSVLSGGEYDNLAKKISKVNGAIGFAVYLDKLSLLDSEVKKYDVDNVILVDDSVLPSKIIEVVESLTEKGESVSVQRSVVKLRYKNLIDMRNLW